MPMAEYLSFEDYFDKNSMDDFIEKYRAIVSNELDRPLDNLAKDGWTIPPYINWLKISSLNPLKNNQSELIAGWVLNYDNNECYLRNIISNCPEKWKTLLSQCVECYFSEKYAICIPSLSTIIEGLISHKLTDQGPEKIRYHASFQDRIAQDYYVGADLIIALSLKAFIKHFFNPSDFSCEEPNIPNRHWLAHGRAKVVDDKIQALRLFNTIASIVHMQNLFNGIHISYNK